MKHQNERISDERDSAIYSCRDICLYESITAVDTSVCMRQVQL